MRWREFSRLSRGQAVVWMPTSERGVVVRAMSRQVWVRWDSGRIDKLDVNEDAFNLVLDKRGNAPDLPANELERRRMNESIRPDPIEDGSPEEFERVWREAREIRMSRECPARHAEPSVVPVLREERRVFGRVGG